jgi:hypothetical protein
MPSLADATETRPFPQPGNREQFPAKRLPNAKKLSGIIGPPNMETLTIHAASARSAQKMLAALTEFPAELVENGDGCMVVVNLGGDAQIVGVLHALQQYVTERGAGAAQVEFNGNSYAMHPEPEPGL